MRVDKVSSPNLEGFEEKTNEDLHCIILLDYEVASPSCCKRTRPVSLTSLFQQTKRLTKNRLFVFYGLFQFTNHGKVKSNIANCIGINFRPSGSAIVASLKIPLLQYYPSAEPGIVMADVAVKKIP